MGRKKVRRMEGKREKADCLVRMRRKERKENERK